MEIDRAKAEAEEQELQERKDKLASNIERLRTEWEEVNARLNGLRTFLDLARSYELAQPKTAVSESVMKGNGFGKKIVRLNGWAEKREMIYKYMLAGKTTYTTAHLAWMLEEKGMLIVGENPAHLVSSALSTDTRFEFKGRNTGWGLRTISSEQTDKT